MEKPSEKTNSHQPEQVESPVPADSRSRPAKKSRPWYIELPLMVITVLLFSFIIQTFIGRIYLIPSESMQPTLNGCPGCDGDRIVVDKMTLRFTDPEPGDVVVFLGPDSWNKNYVSIRSANPVVKQLQDIGSVIGFVPPDENDLVKRVIATEGQVVGGCSADGRLLVDGKPLYEPYLKESTSVMALRNCSFPPVQVPEDHVWVMGDNRSNSADSRFHMSDERQGTVPVDNIIGLVRFILLPMGRTGVVDSPQINAG